MTRKIKKIVEENYTPLTKEQKKCNFRHHLMMMLEAMQYKGRTNEMSNYELAELVNRLKEPFLHALVEEAKRDFQRLYGMPLTPANAPPEITKTQSILERG